MTLRPHIAVVLLAALLAAACSQNQTQSQANSSAAPGASGAASGANGGLQINPINGVFLGPGWYPVEHYNGETFRWANNDPEITACPDAADRTLAMMIEPGPGIGAKTARITITGNRGDQSTASITGRQFAKVNIVKGAPGETFSIHAASHNLPSPHGDRRTLNFRILEATLGFSTASCPNDVARDGSLRIGSGWYAYETYNGDTFRWVNNDAHMTLAAAQPKPFSVQLEVAPGPSLGGAPLLLRITGANDASASSAPVRTRQVVDIKLPAQPAGAKLTISTHSKNVPAPHDKRTLNFQVFNLWVKP